MKITVNFTLCKHEYVYALLCSLSSVPQIVKYQYPPLFGNTIVSLSAYGCASTWMARSSTLSAMAGAATLTAAINPRAACVCVMESASALVDPTRSETLKLRGPPLHRFTKVTSLYGYGEEDAAHTALTRDSR